MSTDTDTGPEPTEREQPQAPTGAEAMAAAAEATDPSPRVQANALAYFMGAAPPPGRDDRLPIDVDFGTPEEPNFQRCVFRTLGNEELVKCEEMATVRNAETGSVERIDPFTRWSYVFAYSCVDPALAPALQERREREQDPHVKARLTDSAALVREVFRFQPGVLQHVSFRIERRSRLGDDAERAVREVEAGKGSR